MSSWAKVGVKCVCINGNGWSASYDDSRPVRGPELDETVVIKGVGDDGLEPVLWLVGYTEDFPVDRFRPLITRSQEDDVALFRNLLVTEGADA